MRRAASRVLSSTASAVLSSCRGHGIAVGSCGPLTPRLLASGSPSSAVRWSHLGGQRHASTSQSASSAAASNRLNGLDAASSSHQITSNLASAGNIPRQDYATPAMYTFGIMSRLFRYSIYASVVVVLGGSALYVTVHTYVEYIALHGREPLDLEMHSAADDSSYFSVDELIPAYSGAHLGGGTDPSIGWKARNAARAAWLALNLQRGGVANTTKGTKADVAIPDKAWLEAESYLRYAVGQAEEQTQDTSLAKRELIERLAEVRCKMGGLRGLSEAKRNYQELILGVKEDLRLQGLSNSVKLARLESQLAIVELRMARELLPPSSPASQQEVSRILARLEAGLHGNTENAQSDAAQDTSASVDGPPMPNQPTQPARSWFSRTLARSEDAPALPAIQTLSPLASLLQSQSAQSDRKLVSDLVILAGTLATSGQLNRALEVAKTGSAFVDRALVAKGSRDGSETLHKAWMSIRKATLDAYAAEVGYALQKHNAGESEAFLNKAVNACENVFAELPSYTKATLFKPAHPLFRFARETLLEAERTGTSAARTMGRLYEARDANYKKALESYESALAMSERAVGDKGDEAAVTHIELLESIRRCREKLMNGELPR